MAALLSSGRAQCVNLRHEERNLRLWASRRRLAGLAAGLAKMPAPPGSDPLVTFYGSGDYHHIATPLIASVEEPVTVIHFDNHPDWVRIPATHNCGGWVNRTLALPQVQRVVTLGVCSDDLVDPQLKGGNLAALASGRLEIHPWRAAPSRVWGSPGDGAGHRRVGRHLVWDCLAEKDWLPFLDMLVARVPTEAVWVTIDKDVLRPADAATNWDQGEMPLHALLDALAALAKGRRIVGVDVCGEFSPPRFDGPIKRIAAWLDHPRATPPQAEALALNDRTNIAVVGTLSRILQ